MASEIRRRWQWRSGRMDVGSSYAWAGQPPARSCTVRAMRARSIHRRRSPPAHRRPARLLGMDAATSHRVSDMETAIANKQVVSMSLS